METEPDWGKRGTIATWVGIAVAILLAMVQEIWPPDPARPMTLNFFSKSLLIPPWLVMLALVVVVALTATIVRRITLKRIQTPMLKSGSAINLTNIFDVHPTSLDQRVTSPQQTVNYTAKMRVSFENKSSDRVRVLPPRWLADTETISVQCGASPYPNVPYTPGMIGVGYRYQMEEYKGSWKLDKWKRKSNGEHDEYPEVTVDPGSTFRIWIGLNPCVPHNDLESRRKTNRLGILILPLEINGQTSEWTCPV